MSDLRKQIREHYDAQKLSAEKVEEILARGRAAAAGEEAEEKVTPFPRRAWTLRSWIPALAAAIAVIAGIVVFLPHREQRIPFAMVDRRIIDFFNSQPKLEEAPQDKTDLRNWLLARGAPAEFHIPATLMPLQSAACEVLDVRGRKMFLSCYWREQRPDRSPNELIHLIAARRDNFENAPGSEVVRNAMEGWSFASWSEGDVLYTLTTPAPPEKLTPFLAMRAPELDLDWR